MKKTRFVTFLMLLFVVSFFPSCGGGGGGGGGAAGDGGEEILPAIGGSNPGSAPPGELITITGTNLDELDNVFLEIDGLPIAAEQVTDTYVTALVPLLQPGIVDLVLRYDDGDNDYITNKIA